MAGGGAGVGGVKVDFWRNDDVVWWGKHESFAHGVEKWGGSCSVLEGAAVGGIRGKNTKNRQPVGGANAAVGKICETPKWRQIGGAILTPFWWRELDLNQRPFGYEPNELPGCSIPRRIYIIAQVVSFGKDFFGLF